MWANIMSAETCGGLELEYVKNIFPIVIVAFEYYEGVEIV